MKLSDAQILQARGCNFNPLDLYQNKSDDLLKRAREVINETLRDFETTHASFASMGEEDISKLLCIAINRTTFFTAEAESFTNGHVDVTILSRNMASESVFAYKGEAKIWKGEKYCLDGFDQLDGYLTGVPPIAFFLYYFRVLTGCDDIFEKYLETLTDDKGGQTVTKANRFATTEHNFKTGINISLDHFSVWLPKAAPKKKVAKKAVKKTAAKKVVKKAAKATKKTTKKIIRKPAKKPTRRPAKKSPKRK
jgi:hypothetical protein